MKTLLKLFGWPTILEVVVASFLRISLKAWQATKELVATAEEQFPEPGSGANKAAWVMSKLKQQFGYLKTHKLETIMGLAVELLTQNENPS